MSGRCPTSGLVCLHGERQGAVAWAAPGPLPRLGPGTARARRGKGGTTPSAYAARSARSMDGEEKLQ